MSDPITHISDLTPDPQNARRHNPRNIGMIERSLNEVGAGRSIVVDENGVILAGNGLVEAAAQAGITKVQVVEADGETIIAVRRTGLTPEQKTKLALFDNRAAELAEWEPGVLAELALDFDLSDLFTAEEWAAVALVEETQEGAGGDEFDTTPEEGPTRTHLGELWSIGGVHRLYVGDCTDKNAVSLLMGGERAQLTITDPPFGVRDDEWDQFDSLEKLIAFTASWMRLCPVDVWAVFFADKYLPLLFEAAKQAGAPQWRRSLIWYKPPGSQFAGASLDGYWYDFELISVFGQPTFKPQGPPKFSVFEHRTVTGQEHGCEKPVGLLEDVIKGYSEEGALLYEPFFGTGTTLIAAHRTGRAVRGCELLPKNADVILRRAEAENLECVLING